MQGSRWAGVWLLGVSLLVGWGGWVWADGAIVVEKGAQERNPTLRLGAFRGPAALKTQILQDLRVSDWFELTEETPDYLLGVEYRDDDRQQVLTLTIADGLNNPLGKIVQEARDADLPRLSHAAVDALIEKQFRQPGWCRAKLAYVKAEGGIKEIYTADFDGSRPLRLTHNRSLSVEPAWGAGDKLLAYTLYNRFSLDVVLVEMAGRKQRRVSSFSGLNASGALSPDGQQLIVALSKDATVDLYQIGVAGGKLRRLTDSRAVEASPCWSPDGKQICFVSDELSSRPTLYLMPATGGKPSRLLDLPEEAVSPAWSPLGGKLAFAMRQGNGYTIAMVDLKGESRAPTVLVRAEGSWEAPSWAPDGRHLICSRELGGRKSLAIVDSWFGKIQLLPGTEGASLPALSGLSR